MAPIGITVYNRPVETEETLKNLLKISKGDLTLYIFSDSWSNPEQKESVLKTRSVIQKYAKQFRECKTFLAKERKNLGNSVIDAVSYVLSKHETIIFLEDDIIISSAFLKYMNDALIKYKDCKQVGSIAGYFLPAHTFNFPNNYQYDLFFSRRPSSWGWATWRDRWEKADWSMSELETLLGSTKLKKKLALAGQDILPMLIAQRDGKINSWAVRWMYHLCMHDLLTVTPRMSYVNNIGFNGKGIHSKTTDYYKFSHTELSENPTPTIPEKIELDAKIDKAIQKFYSRGLRYYIGKFLQKAGLIK